MVFSKLTLILACLLLNLWRVRGNEAKTFLVANVQDIGFQTSDIGNVPSHMMCLILCLKDPICSMVIFVTESGACRQILRGDSTEPVPVESGGIQVYVDTAKPSTFPFPLPCYFLQVSGCCEGPPVSVVYQTGNRAISNQTDTPTPPDQKS